MGQRTRRERKKTKVLIPDVSDRERIIMPDGRILYWYKMLQAHSEMSRTRGLSAQEEYELRRKRRKGFEAMAKASYLYRRGYIPSQIDEMLGLAENRSKYWLEQGGYHKDCSPARDSYHARTRKL